MIQPLEARFERALSLGRPELEPEHQRIGWLASQWRNAFRAAFLLAIATMACLGGALGLLFLNRGERSVADGFVLWSIIGGLSALLAALTLQLRIMGRSMRFWELAIRESMHRRNSYR